MSISSITPTAWACPHHNTLNEPGVPCPACMARFDGLPNPAEMTPDERVAELDFYFADGTLTVPFERLHARFEALCGCSVWTHQLVERDFLRELARRRNGDDNSVDLAIDQLAKYGKPVIEVQL